MYLRPREANQDGAAKRLVDELLIGNFLEEELKLGPEFVNSSILLLRAVTQCPLFDETTVKKAQNQLEELCMNYSREWMSVEGFSSSENAEGKPKSRGVKPKPKLRAQTALGGAIPQSGPQRPPATTRGANSVTDAASRDNSRWGSFSSRVGTERKPLSARSAFSHSRKLGATPGK
jgi:hypothetical protein